MSTEGNGKVAIVTGSANGIGRAIALRLGRDGVRVVVNCLSDIDAGNEVVAEIESVGSAAVLSRTDVADPASMRSLFDVAEERFGGVDIFVHNAASAFHGPISSATEHDFDHVYAINARATFVGFAEG